MDAGQYEEAIEAFEKLDGYQDRDAKILECKYNLGIINYNAGKYQESLDVFVTLNGYKDSESYLEKSSINLYGAALHNFQGTWDGPNVGFGVTITIKGDVIVRKSYRDETGKYIYATLEDGKLWNNSQLGDAYKSSYEIINGNILVETLYFSRGGTTENRFYLETNN